MWKDLPEGRNIIEAPNRAKERDGDTVHSKICARDPDLFYTESGLSLSKCDLFSYLAICPY